MICQCLVIEHSLENRKVKLNSQGNFDIGVGKTGFGELKMNRESTVSVVAEITPSLGQEAERRGSTSECRVPLT